MTFKNILADYVNRPELAAALNVSVRTLSRYEILPDGLPSVLIGGRKLYRVQSVLDWVKSRETHPNKRRSR